MQFVERPALLHHPRQKLLINVIIDVCYGYFDSGRLADVVLVNFESWNGDDVRLYSLPDACQRVAGVPWIHRGIRRVVGDDPIETVDFRCALYQVRVEQQLEILLSFVSRLTSGRSATSTIHSAAVHPFFVAAAKYKTLVLRLCCLTVFLGETLRFHVAQPILAEMTGKVSSGGADVSILLKTRLKNYQKTRKIGNI